MPSGERTIIVVRVPKVDKLSTAPATAPPETRITGVAILPRQTYEQGKGWINIEGRDVYIFPSSMVLVDGALRRYEDGDIVASDRIRLEDNTTWEVEGGVARFEKGREMKAVVVKLAKLGSL